MRKLKATNFNELARRYNLFRYTNVLDEQDKEIMPMPRLIDVIRQEETKARISEDHSNFFNSRDSELKTFYVSELP
jgi:hypothetical protein